MQKISVFILLINLHTYSQWSSSPTVNNPISTTTSDKSSPIAVIDGAGGAVITWEDNRSGIWKIYAQRISVSGTVQWVVDGVAISTLSVEQNSPAMVSDGSGGAIIAWDESRSGSRDIYAQRIAANGTMQWITNGVAISTASDDQVDPSIVSDGTGGAVIIWTDLRNGPGSDIYAQRINASGTVQWTTNGVPISTASAAQAYHTSVSDGAGGAIITWHDERNYPPDQIYAQHINANGTVQWTANGVYISDVARDPNFSGINRIPRIVSDGAGGAIITWFDERNGVNTELIYAQRINASGTVQWSANGMPITTATGNQFNPRISSDGAGGAIITWEDVRSDLSGDIYAQRIGTNGIMQWAASGVPISKASDSQFDPVIVSDGSGGAIISWDDYRNGTNSDIYAQRINASGLLKWTVDGIPISTAANFQYHPAIVADGTGGAIITWDDYRSGTNFDIYCQRIGADGSLGGPTGIRDDKLGTKVFSLEQNYPNPFNPTTVIRYSLLVTGHVTVRVYDVLGREVALLVDEVMPAGTHTVRWNAGNYSSGVYFYQLQAGPLSETRKLVLIR